MTDLEPSESITAALPPLMSIDRTRLAGGKRGRAWVYDRIRAGDFETIRDGSRRLVITESFLKWLDTKRAESQKARKSSDEGSMR